MVLLVQYAQRIENHNNTNPSPRLPWPQPPFSSGRVRVADVYDVASHVGLSATTQIHVTLKEVITLKKVIA